MILFIVGLITGIVSGMGIGGGTVLIPSLIFIIGTSQQVAQSVNLMSFFPTAVIAIIIHSKNKNIKYKTAFYLFLFGFIGAIIGSKLAVTLTSEVLRRLFGFFLISMGIYEFFRKGNEKSKR